MAEPRPVPLPLVQASGTDDHGLICGYWFRPAEPARAIGGTAEAAGLLDAGFEGFLWLHFHLGHVGAEGWLRTHADLGEDFFGTLLTGSRSTRIERDEDRLFAVINDLAYDFHDDAGEMSTLWLSAGPQLIVSARRHPLRAVDQLRTAVRDGEPMGSTIALLDHLLRCQAEDLQAIVLRTTDRIDTIEDAQLAGQWQRHNQDLARLRRLLVRLQRLLAPEPGALARTLAHPPAWLDADGVDRLRATSEDFALVLRDVAALQDRTKLMQDEAASRMAEANNRSLFTLTMVTVLALPINLVAGLMGMNVGGVPFSAHPHGFWWMLSLIGLLSGALAWLVLRRVRDRRD